jgi:hypothetical protein
VRFFRQNFTLEDAIGSHACSLQANMRVINGIPFGSALLLPVDIVNYAETLKGVCSNGVSEQRCPKNGGSMFTCLDHDDGSDYYLDTRNVCVFAGMKNYIGQNKIWDSNLIAYPDGALAQNRSGMPCVWTSMNMGGNRSLLPCAPGGPKPMCHNREVYTNNTCVTHREQAFEFDMFNADDLAEYGPSNTTMPFTAHNQAYLGIEFEFGGWNHTEAMVRCLFFEMILHSRMLLDHTIAGVKPAYVRPTSMPLGRRFVDIPSVNRKFGPNMEGAWSRCGRCRVP